MSKSRWKDANWDLSGPIAWEKVKAALLMDIRDELKRLNSRLSCPEFLAIPRYLRTIGKNTAKPRKKRAKKSAAPTGGRAGVSG